ncbi:chaperone protein [Stylonychia lemnae]|uniref:Chaperone protein n=1 Tax=Stylonychia lemnae TaxID=5949 RepID=A0A077ZP75_STYLE|nr:chaperone protein [Stylonychia lemnae]|eukprot:CDW71259.1 chaperone protein [Stylonychia lemnae]
MNSLGIQQQLIKEVVPLVSQIINEVSDKLILSTSSNENKKVAVDVTTLRETILKCVFIDGYNLQYLSTQTNAKELSIEDTESKKSKNIHGKQLEKEIQAIPSLISSTISQYLSKSHSNILQKDKDNFKQQKLNHYFDKDFTSYGPEQLSEQVNKALQKINKQSVVITQIAIRQRHSMTNLYGNIEQNIYQLLETLGVSHTATKEEIETQYKQMCRVLNVKANPELKVFLDDLTLAYDTLIQDESRAEYDEYVSQHIMLSRLWASVDKEEGDNEEAEKRKKGKIINDQLRFIKERGKRRFEEDYDFANDEFFSSWKTRTKSGQQQSGQHAENDAGAESNKSRYDGRDIVLDISISFQESLSGIEKELSYQRDSICGSCQGSRETPGSSSSLCYSCKGEGVKKDPLFKKEASCNTCNGHGYLIKNPCKGCNGQGFKTENVKQKVLIPKFCEDQSVIEIDERGHQTLFRSKGHDGNLFIKVKVQKDQETRREGLDIISKHQITLTEALLGCQLQIKTVAGDQTLRIGPEDLVAGSQIVLKGKVITNVLNNIQGVYDVEKGQGNHIAEIQVNIPKNLNPDSRALIQQFSKNEQIINTYDPSHITYDQVREKMKQDRKSHNTVNNDEATKHSSFFSRFGL